MASQKMLERFNEAIATKGTDLFGNIWTFYFFLAIGLLPLIPLLAGLISITQYFSTTVVQLAALPLLAVGQQISSRRMLKMFQETHDASLEELRIAKLEMRYLQDLVVLLHKKLDGPKTAPNCPKRIYPVDPPS